MKLRVARHTNDVDRIKDFYQGLLGLELLGEFHRHDGYDGIFLGLPDKDWHLEFTISDHSPEHQADEDDLLVFYAANQQEYQDILTRAASMGLAAVKPHNPYWKKGKIFEDPDGFRVVVAPN